MYTGKTVYELKTTEYTAGITKGFVFRTQEELNEGTCVGFYMPKLLSLMDAADGPKEEDKSVDGSIFANSISAPSSVSITNYIKAKYNGRANFTQPIIATGETAELFFYNGDYKEPRYLDYEQDERRRKTDKIRIFVNSKPNPDDEAADQWYLELNTVDKKIQLHTSTENGEDHGYDFILDVAESKALLTDDAGNFIELSTEDKAITMENSDKTRIELVEKDIHGKADGDITFDCENFRVTAKSAITHKAENKITNQTSCFELKGVICTEIDTKTYENKGITSKFGGMVNIDGICKAAEHIPDKT